MEEKIVKNNSSHIESIKKYAEKLDRTLNNIITYQKISNGTYIFQNNPVTDVPNCFIKIYDKKSIEQQTQISLHFKKIKVAISRNELLFVLSEIIDNVIKFALKSEKIIIKCSTDVK